MNDHISQPHLSAYLSGVVLGAAALLLIAAPHVKIDTPSFAAPGPSCAARVSQDQAVQLETPKAVAMRWCVGRPSMPRPSLASLRIRSIRRPCARPIGRSRASAPASFGHAPDVKQTRRSGQLFMVNQKETIANAQAN